MSSAGWNTPEESHGCGNGWHRLLGHTGLHISLRAALIATAVAGEEAWARLVRRPALHQKSSVGNMLVFMKTFMRQRWRA